MKSGENQFRVEYNSINVFYYPITIAAILLVLGSEFVVYGIYPKSVVPAVIIDFLWIPIILFLFVGVILIFMSISIILSALLVYPSFNKNAKNADTAILFVERRKVFNLIQFYWSGVFWLFLWFRKANKDYNTYFVCSREQLEKIFLDKKLKILYIFGHGRRYGVVLLGNTLYRYKNLNGKLKKRDKEFIAQLHCNSEKEQTAQDITLEQFTKKKNISKGNLSFLQIWYYLFKTWKEKHIISN